MYAHCVTGPSALLFSEPYAGPDYMLTCPAVHSSSAHVHHAYETYVTGGRTRQALVQGLVGSGQFLTCLFRLISALQAPVT